MKTEIRKLMDFSESFTDKLIDGLFTGRKSIILVTDGFSTCKKSVSPGFGVKSRDAIASKNWVKNGGYPDTFSSISAFLNFFASVLTFLGGQKPMSYKL